ncbi:hypothetical protein F2P56_004569 [Juglans regia]|uniref:GRF-type domain-containing protein n=1 Tax=Juglans regia TaxID=51240 RepID=A0A834D899_JUGRE|nr:hypothetical protein F2P56_004569 [Juglans regia]
MSEARSSTSNISRSKNTCQNEYPICFCGIKACRRTAHTEDNDGRQFFTCQNFQAGHSCGYFCWYDPEIPPYGKKKINRLKNEIEKIQLAMDVQTTRRRLEIEIERRKRNVERVIVILVISMSWILCLALFFGGNSKTICNV